MSNSTPGPWHVCDEHNVTRDGVHMIHSHHPLAAADDESRANACLIAAAPELLEACRRAKSLLEDEGYQWSATLILLTQAIAKAEGEQP